MYSIGSARLTLRELTEADVTEKYVGWLNDREVVQFTESRFDTHTRDSVCRFVRTIAADENFYFFAICLKGEGRHIGNIKLGPVNRHHGYADIGLIIGERSCWGQGYATEAIAALSEWAFSTLGLHKLTAGAYASNRASIRAFEKCGFVVEGIRMAHCYDGDNYVDCCLLGKVNRQA